MRLLFLKAAVSGSSLGLFRDMGKYGSVDSYVSALLRCYRDGLYGCGAADNDIPEFMPLEFYIILPTGDTCCFISAGQVSNEADAMLRRLKKWTVGYRSFVGDDMVVRADAFERELIVDMTGRFIHV